MRDVVTAVEQTHLTRRSTSFRFLFIVLLPGIVVAVVAAIMNLIYGLYEWTTISGYATIGYAMVMSGWIAEKLWSSGFAKLFRTPFTIPAYLSRVPFWLLAGGVSYVAAIVVAKKIGFLGVSEIPIWDIFYLGVKLGGCSNLILIILRNSFIEKN